MRHHAIIRKILFTAGTQFYLRSPEVAFEEGEAVNDALFSRSISEFFRAVEDWNSAAGHIKSNHSTTVL